MTKPRVSTALSIAALLWPDFEVVKGCVFLKGLTSPTDTRFPSRTEFDENHVHLLDYFAHDARVRRKPFFNSRHPDFVSASNLGRSVCLMWAYKLRHDFPRWHFRVYFHGFDPIVRFHRVRPRETPVMGDNDRKSEIELGALLIVDTRRLAA